MVRAVNELNYKPKMIGGAMVGLQATVFKMQLGPLLNGFVNYETWVPAKSMMFAGTEILQEVSGERQRGRRRPARLLPRRLGLCLHPVLGEAVEATNSLDDNKIADYIKATRSRPSWRHQVRPEGRVGEVRHAAGAVSWHQAGRRPRAWRGMSDQTVLSPDEYKTGR